METLKTQCAQAVSALSDQSSVHIWIKIDKAKPVEEVTLETFIELNKELYKKILRILHTASCQVSLKNEKITEVLVVDSEVVIPIVRECILYSLNREADSDTTGDVLIGNLFHNILEDLSRRNKTMLKRKEAGSKKIGGLPGKLNIVVLAYSGGLDTLVIVPWLRENYGCEVVCFTADVGQGVTELEGLEAKAKASGASQLVVRDLQREFVGDFIFPCLRAGAIYERKYLLGTSMARTVIAKAMVDVAKEVGADAVCHGCTGKGNDQVRFELTFFALNPELHVVAPWREWDITGKEDAIEYAKKHNVPVPVTKKSIYSGD